MHIETNRLILENSFAGASCVTHRDISEALEYFGDDLVEAKRYIVEKILFSKKLSNWIKDEKWESKVFGSLINEEIQKHEVKERRCMVNRNVDISELSEDIAKVSLIRLFRDLDPESRFCIKIVHNHNLEMIESIAKATGRLLRFENKNVAEIIMGYGEEY